MIPKRIGIRANAEPSPEESLGKPSESYNVCPVNLPIPNRVGAGQDGLVACPECGREFRPDHKGQRFCDHGCYSAGLRVPIQDRFWSKVNRGIGDVCWLWTAATIRGYGQILDTVNGKRRPVYAHRVSWELANGPIPEGVSVLHRCDVPLCVNPAHLFLGSQADNLNDARAKGRLIDGLCARRLSDDAYRDILTTPESRGVGAMLAAKHGVTPRTISRIRRGVQGSTFRNKHGVPSILKSPDPVLQMGPSNLYIEDREPQRFNVMAFHFLAFDFQIVGEVA